MLDEILATIGNIRSINDVTSVSQSDTTARSIWN